MVVIVFRARLKPEASLEARGNSVSACTSSRPRCPATSPTRTSRPRDGENVSVIEFESLETLAAWREHPEHNGTAETVAS